MKKVLIMMMCVIMVVCFMPTVAMAEVSNTAVARIGDTDYATLAEAVKNAESGVTITLLKDCSGGGIGLFEDTQGGKRAEVKDLIFDFGGYTYTCTGPGVGSMGTESQAFHLEKGCNITLKGGTLKLNNVSSVMMGIQNYCNLTLDNFTIDASEDTYCSYALSNNFGNVTISGNTNIKAYTGKVAFDLWYGMSDTYYEGVSVTFDDTFKGTVDGKIEYGANKPLDKWKEKTPLTIKGNGVFNSAFTGSSTNALTDAKITITGGTFSDLSVLGYLGENANVKVKLDGPVNESITIPSGKKVTLDLNGQSITSIYESVIIVSKDSSLVVEDTSNDKTGSITGATVGIKMGNAPENGQGANSSLTINGGTISGDDFGISGNGNRHGTTIIVNNGNITGGATGIYHPQDGKLTVKGGTITGGTGIEIRSGELTVEGGTIKGTDTPAESTANGNGTTTDGAGIAVAQHTTKKPINVIVKGGTIEGYSALYQSNPQNNPPEDVAKVSLQVLGGNLNAINGGTIAVDSENKTGFITGGTFSSDVSGYIPENYVEYAMRNGTYIVKGSGEAKPGFTTGNYWSDLVGKVYTEMYSAPYIPPTTPTTPTDNVTNSGSTGADNATTSADLSGSTSTSNGTTTAEVDKTTADKIVDKAVENKSTEVVIDATANTTTAADSTTIAQVTIPTETLGAIAEKTDADVTIKTDVAEVKMDNAAAAAVSEQAEGDTVQIIAEKVAEDTDKVEFELKVVCSDGKVISNFNGGNIAVTVALPKAMAEKKVVCVYIDDNGHMSKVEGQKNADGTYTFVTGHFSSYAILAEEEADAAIAAQKEAIKNIKIKLTSKQVKTKAGKKAVKITWTADAGDKVLDGVEVFRSKEKNKGYGTEPFYTSTKGGNTGSYTNTKSLKKGTKYYYRVRGYVLVDGQKVYTDYSTKAWRTVK